MDKASNTMVYLVQWKDAQSERSYICAEDFNEFGALSQYHKKLAKANKAHWKHNKNNLLQVYL